MRLSRGVALALVGIVVLSTTLAVSAATAPSRNVAAPQPGPSGVEYASQPSNDSATATDGADTNATTPPPGGPHVLVGSQGGGANWQKHGSVYRLDDHEVVWKINDRDSYFDASMLPNGSVVAGFMHNGYEEGCGEYEPPCSKTGYRILDPSNGSTPEVVAEFSFPIRHPAHSELHDVEPLGENRFVIADMEHERIAVVADGTVEWEWNAAESGFYEAPEDVSKRDWLHINDVDHIGEGRFLVSVRNANQLLVIERGSGVVEVINEDRSDANDASCTQYNQLVDADGDGDVRCGNPTVLNHQHNPQWLGPGRVLVADSDNDRIVELQRTDAGWEPVWRLRSAGGLDLNWPRDADVRSNGNVLVTDSLNRRVFEVTREGDVVWSYGTPLIPYEADPLPRGEVVGETTFGSNEANVTAENATATVTTTVAGSAATRTNGESTGGTGSDAVPAAPEGPSHSEDGPSAADVPGLSLLLVGIKAVVPRLPIWFAEFELLVTVPSLGLVVVGLVDHWRQ